MRKCIKIGMILGLLLNLCHTAAAQTIDLVLDIDGLLIEQQGGPFKVIKEAPDFIVIW